MTTSLLPQFRTLIATYQRSEGDSPRRTFIAGYIYPDCVREYDGKNWKVLPANTYKSLSCNLTYIQ